MGNRLRGTGETHRQQDGALRQQHQQGRQTARQPAEQQPAPARPAETHPRRQRGQQRQQEHAVVAAGQEGDAQSGGQARRLGALSPAAQQRPGAFRRPDHAEVGLQLQHAALVRQVRQGLRQQPGQQRRAGAHGAAAQQAVHAQAVQRQVQPQHQVVGQRGGKRPGGRGQHSAQRLRVGIGESPRRRPEDGRLPVGGIPLRQLAHVPPQSPQVEERHRGGTLAALRDGVPGVQRQRPGERQRVQHQEQDGQKGGAFGGHDGAKEGLTRPESPAGTVPGTTAGTARPAPAASRSGGGRMAAGRAPCAPLPAGKRPG